MERRLSSQRTGLPLVGQLLRPHWIVLVAAFLAVLGETLADILEPWPVKLVVDNVLPAVPKKLPGAWAAFVLNWFGQDKLAILNFVLAMVLLIAVVGAVSSYFEKYLTTSVAQWVALDLRRLTY